MTDKTGKQVNKASAEKRRKLLKTVAAGGGAIIAGKTLPEKWSKPAIDSVLLPAHAQTSLAGTYSGATRAALESDSLFARALNSMIPESHAASGIQFDVTWCITPGAGNTANVWFLAVEINTQFAELWSASGVQIGVTTPLAYTDGCSSYVGGRGAKNDWLNELGLINDAEAGSRSAEVTLDGLNVGDSFRFQNFTWSTVVDGTLSIGLCGPDSVENCKGRRL